MLLHRAFVALSLVGAVLAGAVVSALPAQAVTPTVAPVKKCKTASSAKTSAHKTATGRKCRRVTVTVATWQEVPAVPSPAPSAPATPVQTLPLPLPSVPAPAPVSSQPPVAVTVNPVITMPAPSTTPASVSVLAVALDAKRAQLAALESEMHSFTSQGLMDLSWQEFATVLSVKTARHAALSSEISALSSALSVLGVTSS